MVRLPHSNRRPQRLLVLHVLAGCILLLSLSQGAILWQQSRSEYSKFWTTDPVQELPLQKERQERSVVHGTIVQEQARTKSHGTNGSTFASFSKLLTTSLYHGSRSLHSLPVHRKDRFPSVEERIQLYMAKFYLPPCKHVKYAYQTTKSDNRYNTSWTSKNVNTLALAEPGDSPQWSIFLTSNISSDHLFFLHHHDLQSCLEGNEYCRDVQEQIEPLLSNASDTTPILLQFGDLDYAVNLPEPISRPANIPIIKKYRQSLSRLELANIIQQRPTCTKNSKDHALYTPIIWKLETQRHYEKIPKVDERDCAWSRKLNKAIFWGAPTNRIFLSLAQGENQPQETKQLSPKQQCLGNPRCRLVLTHANSTLVKAKLVKTRGRWPDIIDGVNITGGRIPMQKIIRYKGIIMLEGNDVSSGLKWALRSNSVVLMPRPTRTSWAMEELLEEWVHYVPLSDTLEDVEEQMQWILDHDEEAYHIAQQGKLWMKDLLEHPDAARDNLLVNQGIMKRYLAHFTRIDD